MAGHGADGILATHSGERGDAREGRSPWVHRDTGGGAAMGNPGAVAAALTSGSRPGAGVIRGLRRNDTGIAAQVVTGVRAMIAGRDVGGGHARRAARGMHGVRQRRRRQRAGDQAQ